MQTIYMSDVNGGFRQIDEIKDGAWVSLIEPTAAEIDSLAQQCAVDADDLRSALDVEERSRITAEDGYVLVLVDVPTTELRSGREWYVTIPLGIVITKTVIITVCSERVSVIAELETGRVRDFRTFMKTRFTLQLLMRNAGAYLSALRVADKMIDRQEANLRQATRNQELVNMMELERSLLYINTSLVSNQRVLNRLVRTTALKKYPEDDDLLEDTIVENEQALEMSGIYSGILSGMMDAYASVISNNQNVIMKTLAIATIVLSIPTMIFSAYGMNLNLDGYPLQGPIWGFWGIVGAAFVLAGLAIVFMARKKWF